MSTNAGTIECVLRACSNEDGHAPTVAYSVRIKSACRIRRPSIFHSCLLSLQGYRTHYLRLTVGHCMGRRREVSLGEPLERLGVVSTARGLPHYAPFVMMHVFLRLCLT